MFLILLCCCTVSTYFNGRFSRSFFCYGCLLLRCSCKFAVSLDWQSIGHPCIDGYSCIGQSNVWPKGQHMVKLAMYGQIGALSSYINARESKLYKNSHPFGYTATHNRDLRKTLALNPLLNEPAHHIPPFNMKHYCWLCRNCSQSNIDLQGNELYPSIK